MPTYGYACAKCGHEFDCVQSIADSAYEVCPKDFCAQKRWGRGKVKRTISAGAGLIFKGSGFYITDYRSENYKKGAQQDSASASKPASDAKPKTDSKPAAAPVAKPSKPSSNGKATS